MSCVNKYYRNTRGLYRSWKLVIRECYMKQDMLNGTGKAGCKFPACRGCFCSWTVTVDMHTDIIHGTLNKQYLCVKHWGNAAVCMAMSRNQIFQFCGYISSQIYATKSALFWPSNSGVILLPEAELQTRQLKRQNWIRPRVSLYYRTVNNSWIFHRNRTVAVVFVVIIAKLNTVKVVNQWFPPYIFKIYFLLP
jgi:hypothetical protein